MGRSPCCDKVGLKKGPWTPEEDHKLLAYVDEHGHGNWRALPSKAGLQRCGKSCRLRWTNYLRPDIVRGKFSLQEEQTIIQLHALLGNRWSAIATHLPKRTDNEIKNYWNTHLKKRLTKMGIDPVTHKPKNDALIYVEGAGQSKSTANLSHMAQWESARLEAEARLARQSKLKINPTHTQLDKINLLEYNININPHHQPTSSTSLNNLGSTSSSPPPPPPPPPATTRCLDHVLRAWQHGAQHSPTSTLSFSENGSAIAVGPTTTATTITTTTTTTTTGEGATTAMIEFMGNKNNSSADGYDDVGVGMASLMPTFTSGLHEMSGSSQPDHQGSFIEGFTELLLCNFTERSLSPDDDDGDGGGGPGVTEDNKSYWNSILNLVNSSSSSSPLF